MRTFTPQLEPTVLERLRAYAARDRLSALIRERKRVLETVRPEPEKT